ncbi:hypothetical protein LLH00_02135 [bacterium]|nr:hypothetical protein [bacterium]
MTRLQKHALTELAAPVTLALVLLALCYFGSDMPLKKALDYFNFAFMGLSMILGQFLRADIKSQGEMLTPGEQNVVLRSHRVAGKGALLYIVLAVIVYSHFQEKTAGEDIFTYHLLVYVIGTMFAAQMVRAWAVFVYTSDPEAAAKPIKFPG